MGDGICQGSLFGEAGTGPRAFTAVSDRWTISPYLSLHLILDAFWCGFLYYRLLSIYHRGERPMGHLHRFISFPGACYSSVGAYSSRRRMPVCIHIFFCYLAPPRLPPSPFAAGDHGGDGVGGRLHVGAALHHKGGREVVGPASGLRPEAPPTYWGTALTCPLQAGSRLSIYFYRELDHYDETKANDETRGSFCT